MFKKLVLMVFVLVAVNVFGQVSTTTTEIQYAGNGSSTEFAFNFPLPGDDTSDLTVILRLVSTGVPTTLTETTHYTVTATNNEFASGGTVTTVATYSSDYTLTIRRDSPDTQEADITTDSGVLRKAVLEGAIDKNTMLIQQQQTDLNRTPRFPASDPSASLGNWPSSIDRAGLVAAFDNPSGAPTAISALPTSSVAVTPFAETYMDDLDLAATMATLQSAQTFNPKNAAYGAVGDGVVDDTAAMTACSTAAGQANGKMVIPPGTYLVTTWEITDKVVIEGQGTYSEDVVIKSVSAGVPAIRVLVNASSYTEIMNLEVNVNGNNCGIEFDEAHNGIKVERVFFNGNSNTDNAIIVQGGNYLLVNQCLSISFDEADIENTGCTNVFIKDHISDPTWGGTTTGSATAVVLDSMATGGALWINNLWWEWVGGTRDVVKLDNSAKSTVVFIDGMFVNVDGAPQSYVHQLGAGSIEPISIKGVQTGFTPTYVILNDDDATRNVVVAPTQNASPGHIVYYTPFTVMNERIIEGTIALYGNDATPSAKIANNISIDDSTPTTITDFDNGVKGQKIRVVFIADNSTVDFSSGNLRGNNGVNWNPKIGDSMTAMKKGDLWYCIISGTLAPSNIVSYENASVFYENEIVYY